ncbi:NADH dehydrogenase [ubiquinone] 1 beta subcomplex subunit 9-like [Ostrea edulis]|uniref:NADH dehydrogenase [ubiquinone] 1 beta subcomplex subunit 9-like n=1 Tax=Ostrea edulis TaxID=37623 RepID=UPI002095059A|nr:NADH dehydrogenase [ubiquinone] 1 beta subcomplex subunit 9-like [Ostrea edulis]
MATCNKAATRIPQHLRYTYLSHGQRVLRYYKRACRNFEANAGHPLDARMSKVELRAKIDANKYEADYVKAAKMLEEAEADILTKWVFPAKNWSPGGTCYGRYIYFPDYFVDYWHPLEKAQYPKYFATREIRKMEYIMWWQKKYGTGAGEETEKREPAH